MKNSKENIDTIAKNCGFSKQKVWRMIKQLEKDQKIWGYSTVVDNKKQNLSKFMLFFSRSEVKHDPKDIDEIIKNLLAPVKKELGITMVSSYYIHGQYDWVMIFSAHDIMQAKKFADWILQKFPGKQNIHISQILFTVRENYIQNPNIIEMKEYI
jgi:DNA-binding Lrp family transcriptional regulator